MPGAWVVPKDPLSSGTGFFYSGFAASDTSLCRPNYGSAFTCTYTCIAVHSYTYRHTYYIYIISMMYICIDRSIEVQTPDPEILAPKSRSQKS